MVRGATPPCPVAAASTYFVVEHSFHFGMYDAWWAAFSKSDAVTNPTAWIEKQVTAGVFNSVFMPMNSGPMFCIWEVKAGVNGSTLQKFIDDELGFNMLNNKLMQIDPRGMPYPSVKSLFNSSDPLTAAKQYV